LANQVEQLIEKRRRYRKDRAVARGTLAPGASHSVLWEQDRGLWL